MDLISVKIDLPEGINVIIGQSHFIKTVEDLFETLVSNSPSIKFGIGFCESSGKALIRHDGNDKELEDLAIDYAQKLSAGHVFVVVLKDAYPINVLQRIRLIDEVAGIYAATANPLEVIVAESEQGRGVLGVIDGVKSMGVEQDSDKKERHDFLRKIGYKR